MVLAVLAFLGGALTILSPCILPVLPFVFARAGRSFARSTLPLLVGMAVTFAAIATLAAVGGSWAVRLNDYGRLLALALLAISGLALVSERLSEWLSRPFVRLGNRLAFAGPDAKNDGVSQSVLIGIATGFLWAPCAGPILGLILTGAVINGPGAGTTALLFAYALGAITSLAVATLAGNHVIAALKRSLGFGEWLKRGVGVAVLAAVVIVAMGWDTGVLTRLSLASTNRLEQSLIDAIHPDTPAGGAPETAGETASGAMTSRTGAAMTGAMTGAMNGAMTGSMTASKGGASRPRIEGDVPSFDGAVAWLNSPALSSQKLRGKVVLIDFWTYSCINCLRALPYVRGWYERYRDKGLVVIGVHAPEFAFEKNEGNVKRAVRDLGIAYPVALDNDYAIWRAFNNQYWPAHYFIDAMGQIRGHHFGEGDYENSEQLLRELLTEAGAKDLPDAGTNLKNDGVQAPADERNVGSPETYLGYERAKDFASPGGMNRDQSKSYVAPPELQLNQWAFAGTWRVVGEKAVSTMTGARIVFRFHARDLHLVIGPETSGKSVRFRVTVDGKAPGPDHGADIDASGAGVVREQRLYQLIRQSDSVGDKTFEIEFLDAGAEAYSFTFG